MGMLDEYLWRDVLDYEIEKVDRLSKLGMALELSTDKEYSLELFKEDFGKLSEDDWNWLIDHYNIS